MYKLIALDIDGTLTNDQKDITPITLEALMKAQDQGIRLILASARPAPGLHLQRDRLHMTEHHGILMSYNGGKIIDAETEEVLFEITMDLETTKDVLRFLETVPVTVILDDCKQFYVVDKNGYKVEYECKNNGMTCTEVDNLADFVYFKPSKLLMSVDPEEILEVQKKIADYLPEELTVVRTAPFYLEIIPRIINKGQGIRDICQVLNIPTDEVIAFGDAENDITMLQAAGLGVAMANAEDVVKENADVVTDSNNNDGIATLLATVL